MDFRFAGCLAVGVVLFACSADTVPSVAAQTPAGTEAPGTSRAKVISDVSAKELGHSVSPVTYFSAGAAISYWAADSENQPWEDGWTSPGIVMAGLGDIEETPVAVRILTKASDRFLKDQSVDESKKGEEAVALLGAPDGRVRLRFTITRLGHVSVDGATIGVVE